MKKELKIGIIMVIILGSVIWGVNFLKGKNVFSRTKNYVVIYDEVNSLLESNGVFVKGYKVGHVSDIRFTDKTLQKLTVIIAIERDIRIPRGSVAKIYSEDLMGTKAVELLFSHDKSFLDEGDTMVADIEVSVAKQLEPYKSQAYRLLSSMDSLSNAILNVFNSATVKNLHETFQNINISTESLALSSNAIENTLINLESITKNLRDNNNKINSIISNLNKFSDTLSTVSLQNSVRRLDETLTSTAAIIENLKKGHGSLGKVINNDSLYNSLNKSIADLDSLILDLNKNPKKYVHFSVF
jgi:phospholipid/cholesterol/gamma-HCH transport system substrate-binding protein